MRGETDVVADSGPFSAVPPACTLLALDPLGARPKQHGPKQAGHQQTHRPLGDRQTRKANRGWVRRNTGESPDPQAGAECRGNKATDIAAAG